MKVLERVGTQAVLPTIDRGAGGLLGGLGAGLSVVGQDKKASSSIVRVGRPGEVAALDEVLHELAGGLFGDTEMLGKLCGCRGRTAQAGEGEAVHRPNVVEAAIS